MKYSTLFSSASFITDDRLVLHMSAMELAFPDLLASPHKSLRSQFSLSTRSTTNWWSSTVSVCRRYSPFASMCFADVTSLSMGVYRNRKYVYLCQGVRPLIGGGGMVFGGGLQYRGQRISYASSMRNPAQRIAWLEDVMSVDLIEELDDAPAVLQVTIRVYATESLARCRRWVLSAVGLLLVCVLPCESIAYRSRPAASRPD